MNTNKINRIVNNLIEVLKNNQGDNWKSFVVGVFVKLA